MFTDINRQHVTKRMSLGHWLSCFKALQEVQWQVTNVKQRDTISHSHTLCCLWKGVVLINTPWHTEMMRDHTCELLLPLSQPNEKHCQCCQTYLQRRWSDPLLRVHLQTGPTKSNTHNIRWIERSSSTIKLSPSEKLFDLVANWSNSIKRIYTQGKQSYS